MPEPQLRCRQANCPTPDDIAYHLIRDESRATVAYLCATHGSQYKEGQLPGYHLEKKERPLKMQPQPEVTDAAISAQKEPTMTAIPPSQLPPRIQEKSLPTTVTTLAVPEYTETAPLTAHDIKQQVQLIQEVMQAVMQEGYHYGVIPGTDKPTLLKPGAEKLAVTFRLAPLLHVEWRDFPNGHRECEVRCTLTHIPTGRVYGEGVGLCSTMESRYRYRNANRKCPQCGNETIIKGKAEYGGGHLCFQKKGGCGAKFSDNDPAILNQPVGRIENIDLADVYNTILKMAKKRALVDATLTATAASDIFTQDLEDVPPSDLPEPVKTPPPPQRPAQPQAKAAAPTSVATPAETSAAQRPITKGQYEILLLSQRRSKVSAQEFRRYLTNTYHVNELKELKQSALTPILEWLEAQHEQQLQAAEERANDLPVSTPVVPRREAAPGLVISEPQLRRLHAIRDSKLIPEDAFHQWLEQIYTVTSTADITRAQYNDICNAIEDGTVTQWLHEFADDVPSEWPDEPGARG